MVIDSSGTFTGNPGYARNNTLRTQAGFSDLLMVHILPGDGQPSIEERDVGTVDTMEVKPTDPMCKQTQQTQMQSNGSPRLQAAPGAMVALRYQENGHVSLPQTQAGKPQNRGSVYIYGTTQPKNDEKFLDIFNVWNADGSGGDKRGKLLATQNFDDGHCYQMNSGNISSTRQKQYSHTADKLMGQDLWCQNDIAIPSDAPSGKPYTLYWVWDWPTEPNVDPGLPKGKAEIYTTCMDIDITTAGKAKREHEARDAPRSDINNQAIPAYLKSLGAGSSGSAAAVAPVSAPAAPAAQPSAPAAGASPMVAVAPQASAGPAQESPVAVPSSAAPAAPQPMAQSAAVSAMTVTVTAPGVPQQAVTVTVEATPSASSVSVVNVPSATVTLQTSATSTVYTSGAQAAASGGASLSIQPPVMAPSAQSASPSAAAPVLSQFSGTATPLASSPAANAAAPMVSGRSCSAGGCRPVRRSRIFGAAH